LASITLQLSDKPGALAEVATLAGELGANIIEVVHQRDFSALSARDTELQIAVETRDRLHAHQLVAALAARGLRVVKTSIDA
jgi:threonine dehydratase